MTDPGKVTRGRMGRIDQLDEDLRQLIYEMLRAGKTQKEIGETLNAALAERGEKPIALSSLNTFVNRPSVHEIAQRARLACEFGISLARSAEEDGAKMDRALIHAAQTAAMETFTEVDWRELEPEDRVKLNGAFSLMVRRLVASGVLADARARAIRKEAAEAAAEAAADAAGREAKDAGAPFSPEALRRIREEVYGIVEGPPA